MTLYRNPLFQRIHAGLNRGSPSGEVLPKSTDLGIAIATASVVLEIVDIGFHFLGQLTDATHSFQDVLPRQGYRVPDRGVARPGLILRLSYSMKPVDRTDNCQANQNNYGGSAPSTPHGGATVPFIALYRKETTGALDDAQLRTLEARLNYLRELEERRAVILKSIREQGKLDAALETAILAADSKGRLEDIYLLSMANS